MGQKRQQKESHIYMVNRFLEKSVKSIDGEKYSFSTNSATTTGFLYVIKIDYQEMGRNRSKRDRRQLCHICIFLSQN